MSFVLYNHKFHGHFVNIQAQPNQERNCSKQR